jgi:hypothetical protein
MGQAQVITSDNHTSIFKSGNDNVVMVKCDNKEASSLIAAQIEAKKSSTFYDKEGNCCLCIVYSEDTKIYEVTGYEPMDVLFKTTKITEVRKFCTYLILKQL